MKKMRKALALLLVAAMAMSLLCVGVFAANDGSIKVPNESGHTYEIYQIFTGDYANGVLSNVKPGQNAKTGIDVDAALEAITATSDDTDTAQLAVIKEYVNLTGTAYKANIAAGTTVAVDYGYYLIKDKDGSLVDEDGNPLDDSYTLYLVQVAGTVVLNAKADKPSVEKKVKDTNDSVANSTTGWQDSADYDIGDEIPYQITATMGDMSNYKTYYVQFVDTMSKGLTYQKITSVTVGTTTLEADQYTVATVAGENGATVLKVTINDVKALGAQKDTLVVVEYTAKLNDKAVIGSAGNPNTVKLIYSNNPNSNGDGDKGETPEDKNIVFTYKVVANKVDQDKKALVGASFKLEKKLADGSWKDLGTIDGTNDSTFEWKGIDDGEYKIVETKTPAGYNTIADQYFTVTAKHSDGDSPALTELNGNAAEGSVITLTADKTAGSLASTIENKSGSTLPTTGGMGTTLFYVLGAILVLGAGVLLVTRKRMAHE